MTLGEKRRRFSKMLALLLHYIEFLGVDYALDQGKRCKDCHNTHPRSTHKVGLGQDIILYAPGGIYPHPTEKQIHTSLHDFWDLLGGAKRIAADLNHYSLEHNGVR